MSDLWIPRASILLAVPRLQRLGDLRAATRRTDHEFGLSSHTIASAQYGRSSSSPPS
ncbi:hypothetical protein BURKHO8Y_210199 [Burkholderia sp. 8Y]|nr:hypothetical protein BURKHO8Y_210199 [Burkholderia sp. 8Y]